MNSGREDDRNQYSVNPYFDSEPRRKQPGLIGTVVILLVSVLSGIVFGFAIEKGRVFEPKNIRYQMIFRKWIMMKMFLGAMGTGAICFGILSVIPVQFVKRKFIQASSEFEEIMASKNAVSIGLGAFILGIGMTLSGACPGMVLPQVGAWAHQAIFTLIGALFASLVYGVLHDVFYERIFPSDVLTLPSSFPKLTGVRYIFVTLPMGIIVLAVVLLLEVLVDWKKDVYFPNYNYTSYVSDDSQSAPSIFQLVAWPPSICGVIIGLMQVPILLTVGDTLGGSSSYCTVTSQLLCTRSLKEMFPYLANFQRGVQNWWQVFYVCGAIGGGAVSAALSQTIGHVAGVPVVYALTGGFCLLFGARIGSGCTSGHGLSGSGLLLLGSFFAVPCMFAGAISTAFIMLAVGELDKFCDFLC